MVNVSSFIDNENGFIDLHYVKNVNLYYKIIIFFNNNHFTSHRYMLIFSV